MLTRFARPLTHPEMNVLDNFEPVVKRLLYQGQETSQELINQLFEKNASVVAVVGCIAAVATGTLSLHLAKKVGITPDF